MQKVYLKRHAEIVVGGKPKYFHAGEQIVEDGEAKALLDGGQAVAVRDAPAPPRVAAETTPAPEPYSARRAREEALKNPAPSKVAPSKAAPSKAAPASPPIAPKAAPPVPADADKSTEVNN